MLRASSPRSSIRNYVYLKADAAAERTEAEAEPTLPEPDPTLLAQLGRALTFRYGHAQAIDLPSKVTATELKRLEAEDTPPEDTGAPLLAGAPRTQTFRRPDFSARARKLTAAERGTATHRILQYLHFCRRAHAGGHPRAGRVSFRAR